MKHFSHYLRGEVVWYKNSNTASKHVQQGDRPFLILQNDKGNAYSSTIIGAPITTKNKNPNLPTHIQIDTLNKPSVILLEQITTIDKESIIRRKSMLKKEDIERVDHALMVSLGLFRESNKTEMPITKQRLMEMDQDLLKEVIQALDLLPSVQTPLLAEPLAKNLSFGELKPIHVSLQGNVAHYEITDHVNINLLNGKLKEEAIYAFISELENIKKIIS